MFKTLLALALLTPTLALATVKPDDVIAIRAPRGVRVVMIPKRDRPSTAAELVARYTEAPPAFTFRQSFAQLSEPISEPDLYSRYRTESGLVLSKFVRMAVELMRSQHVTLNVKQGTPVRYDVEPIHRAERTTVGMVDACWECYGGAGNREYISHALGLDSGSLENRVSDNPRFTPRQLFRGSASVLNLTFETNERGTVHVPLLVQLDESYQPFVADLPPTGKKVFGGRVFGSSQRLKLVVSAPLDVGTFGVDHVEWTELDLFSIAQATPPADIPMTFLEVRDYAVEQGPRRNFVRKAIDDLNYYLRAFHPLSRDRLILPGKLQMLETSEY